VFDADTGASPHEAFKFGMSADDEARFASPLATVPAVEIVVLVALGALVLADLVAAAPAQMAARTLTAVVLGAE
jgi:hypothetical protein